MSSRIWQDYVAYIDRIVLDGLCSLVHRTLQLFLTNMDPEVGPGVPVLGVPLLSVRLVSLVSAQTQRPHTPCGSRAMGLWHTIPQHALPVSGPGVPAVRGSHGAVRGPGAVPALAGRGGR